ncbi:MAG: hypothetical protein K2J98_01310, partial [Malacoplasma sp.]|nr:hypothetical protein [Malacoplasma sp.]
NDKLDFLSGLYLNKYSGEFVKKNETIITVYASSEIDEQILNKIKENIEISDKKIDLNKTILKVSK